MRKTMKTDGPWVTNTLNEMEDRIRELESENKYLINVNRQIQAQVVRLTDYADKLVDAITDGNIATSDAQVLDADEQLYNAHEDYLIYKERVT